MGLSSMTGFASESGSHDGWHFTWELKSVNGKNLDLRLKMPPGLESLEASLREKAAKYFRRGSMQANLQITADQKSTQLRVNEAALEAAISIAEKLASRLSQPMPSAAALLALPGVMEASNAENISDDVLANRQQALSDTFEAVLKNLNQARIQEGEKLETILAAHIARIAELANNAKAQALHVPAAQLAKLTENIEKLFANHSLDAQRLHQEAALMAARADISEEIDRLLSHVAAANDLLKAEAPQGRKLDFLAQEFNREANTLCAKSADTEITRIGLELKSVIDQFREQVQNIE